MGRFVSGGSEINEDVTITGETTFNGTIGFADGGALTIANGTVTVTHSSHTLISQTVSSSGTDENDDLNRKEGGSAGGQLLILRKDSTMEEANFIDVIDNLQGESSGSNINIVGNRKLSDQFDTIVLMWNGARWIEIAYADNET